MSVRIISMAALAAVCICGCRSNDSHRPLTIQDSHAPVAMTVNTSRQIKLPANPTTGYVWQLNAQQHPQGTVSITHDGFSSSAKNLCGAPGETTYTIRAMREGSATLTLQYLRPWEQKTPPEKTVSFRIAVKKAEK